MSKPLLLILIAAATHTCTFLTVAPEVKIRKMAEIRDALKKLTKEWEELDRIYQKELGKKKVGRFSSN